MKAFSNLRVLIEPLLDLVFFFLPQTLKFSFEGSSLGHDGVALSKHTNLSHLNEGEATRSPTHHFFGQEDFSVVRLLLPAHITWVNI